MTPNGTARDPRNYRVGIDVGTYSVGLAAIEVDDRGSPVGILNAMSHLHDSGVLVHDTTTIRLDAAGTARRGVLVRRKTAITRLAAAGTARRGRRLRRRRSKRLVAMDRQFADWGWSEPEPSNDPYDSWRARARLATERVNDVTERNALLVVALRHMARHRGWRNPYTRVGAFFEVSDPSEFFVGYRKRVENHTGRSFGEDVTVAELAVAAIDFDTRIPLRMGKTESGVKKGFSFLGGKLMQADNANEMHAYARVQGIDSQLLRELIGLVFAAESPRGSHFEKIGKDPFDNRPRAPKASDAFQRFRIVSVLANVRVKVGTTKRSLSLQERRSAYDYLANVKTGEQPTWTDVSKALGLPRGALRGVASLDDEWGERLPLRPPVHVTDHHVRAAGEKITVVRDWWLTADWESRDALVSLLIDGRRDEESAGGAAAWELLDGLHEEALSALDSLDLPAGRASYSITTLRKLADRMLTSDEDLHEARKSIFGIDDNWVPPSEPINAPIGNPAVDRVTKIVARWLLAAEAEWGVPQRITIEHVRDAFASKDAVLQREKEMQQRYEANEKTRLQVKHGEKAGGRTTFEDVRRQQAITRQNSGCTYCGTGITFHTSEMDHIVPRKGPGSTNARTNLMAVCVECNRSKGNLPFATWASSTNRPGVSVEEATSRVRFWERDPGISPKSWRLFKAEVAKRLERTEHDPEIDGRSMESVAWMANELRDRIATHFRSSKTPVQVYQGAVTAGARGAAGIADKIPFIGGSGKTRLDRRHHAVDAAVVTLLDGSVARTLAERNSMRVAQRIVPDYKNDWREHDGGSPASRKRFAAWKLDMGRLAELLIEAFEQDRVIVMQNLRLRLRDGPVHAETIRPCVRRTVGSALTRDEIDAASTPALWTALTRDPDYDPNSGLPENSSRRLRLRGDHLSAHDEIEFFDKPLGRLAVRGGWSKLDNSIHHARIYRWEERGEVKYGLLAVYAADLAKHRKKDLFSVLPDPSWISMRRARSSIGRSDLAMKEQIGWVVTGDEMLVDMDPFNTGKVADIKRVLRLSGRVRWKVLGVSEPQRFILKPAYVAGEGFEKFKAGAQIDEEALPGADALLNKTGWVVSISQLFGLGKPVIVRRDALGRPRLQASTGLPLSWRVE